MSNMCVLTNRSAGLVSYLIPEDNIHRIFQPGESKKITLEEIEKLSYQPGGNELLSDFLMIKEKSVMDNYGITPEPEYYMNDEDVIRLIKEGSLDAWLDCLDFAPTGVIDLIKKYSVTIPLSDYEKRKSLKEKIGFDIDSAIKYEEEKKKVETTPEKKIERRTQPTVSTGTTERRTIRYNANKN